jgi:ABC-type spermidine/putrescine transport system permease subunit I
MTASTIETPRVAARSGPTRRLSVFLHQHPKARLTGLLTAPMLWLGVIYLGSLAILLASAFWTTNSFTGALVRTFTLENFQDVFSSPTYRAIAVRTFGVAVAVTIIDLILAIPMSLYMAKVASPRVQRILVVAVLMPLWANYLVKAYAWRGMFANNGVLEWLHLPNPGYGLPATIIVLAYLWLPYMILPIYAGLERMPNSLIEASSDLGASSGRTIRSVVLPIVMPSIIAGTIFTFSLSLGDYIAVQLVGAKTQLLGNAIYANIGAANNLPLAAALATIPIVIILGYLLLVRRTGALEEL